MKKLVIGSFLATSCVIAMEEPPKIFSPIEREARYANPNVLLELEEPEFREFIAWKQAIVEVGKESLPDYSSNELWQKYNKLVTQPESEVKSILESFDLQNKMKAFITVAVAHEKVQEKHVKLMEDLQSETAWKEYRMTHGAIIKNEVAKKVSFGANGDVKAYLEMNKKIDEEVFKDIIASSVLLAYVRGVQRKITGKPCVPLQFKSVKN